MNGHEWMMEQHARSAVAHDRANLFPHIVGVAVYRADRAEGLDLHARTACNAIERVVAQAAAVGAECIRVLRCACAAFVFIAAAVDGNHLRHDVAFEGAFLFGIHSDASILLEDSIKDSYFQYTTQ